MAITPEDEAHGDEERHGPHRPLRSLVRQSFSGLWTLLRKAVWFIAFVLLVLVCVRAYLSTQGPPLRPWQTIVPEEPSADTVAHGDWRAYVRAEDAMYAKLHGKLEKKMEPGDRTPLNRYYDASIVSPLRFERDWNRSFVLEPRGAPRGVAVLLHGLTDSPYSMLSLAELYREHGFVALVPRMPGHGTVPAGLTRQGRKEWYAAVDMAMGEAQRRTAGKLPVHLVGYSNGGALALTHVLRRLERGESAGVQRIVLLSPMIEVNRFARYAGLAGLPALFGRWAKSAWLDLMPEFNAFKYNSFPVRAARESYLVTSDLQATLTQVAAKQRMNQLPPILAFQSVVDDTVSARAVMTRLFEALPSNGSELVLFDVNRSRVIAPILRSAASDWSRDVLQSPRRYAVTIVGATSDSDANVLARSRPANAEAIVAEPIGMRYPADVYSLSHVALPFPQDDPLYGNISSGRGGLQLGAIAVRGERNALMVSQDSLVRLGFNPFHSYMLARIAAKLPKG
ncbi:alpha/beta fold hydrolase [Lysobacter sp. FW306-1B-D06B]|uniref:alpha/beta hydrolase n=1 Tax=Lysobacter sp. FW306-1B-D06B TaxID=3140250 RepID=UPI003140BF72